MENVDRKAGQRTTLATERIGVSENDDCPFGAWLKASGCNPAPSGLHPHCLPLCGLAKDSDPSDLEQKSGKTDNNNFSLWGHIEILKK